MKVHTVPVGMTMIMNLTVNEINGELRSCFRL